MLRPEYQKGKQYTGDSSQGIRYPLVPLWGSKNEVVASEHNKGSVLAKSNLGADSRKTAPLLLSARTFYVKHLYVF